MLAEVILLYLGHQLLDFLPISLTWNPVKSSPADIDCMPLLCKAMGLAYEDELGPVLLTQCYLVGEEEPLTGRAAAVMELRRVRLQQKGLVMPRDSRVMSAHFYVVFDELSPYFLRFCSIPVMQIFLNSMDSSFSSFTIFYLLP